MKDDHIDVLLEEVRDQNRAVLEAVGQIQQQLNELLPVKSDVAQLTSDMKIVKAAVTDQSLELRDHGSRLTRLEEQPLG